MLRAKPPSKTAWRRNYQQLIDSCLDNFGKTNKTCSPTREAILW